MATLKDLGEPIHGNAKRVERTPDTDRAISWHLSDAAKRDIEEIEANARASEQRTASLILCAH